MDGDQFHIAAEEFEGCRLILVHFPSAITMQTVSVAISQYLAFWETNLPVVVLNDVTRLVGLSDEARPVLLAIVKRNLTQPGFLGSVYCTGGNEWLEAQLCDLMVEAGRDPAGVVATQERALEYLRECIARGKP